MQQSNQEIKGISRCVRYAFMPNRLHLCGPENQADILEFYATISKKRPGKSIRPLLESFETMYPYLELLARENQNKNPFDEKIVEAYWVGNRLLDNVGGKSLFKHLSETVNLKKHLGFKEFIKFAENFNIDSFPHHNFHIFNIYRRKGKTKELHNLASYDACRISWGKIVDVGKKYLRVKTNPLKMDGRGKIYEDSAIEKEILNEAEDSQLLTDAKSGDYVSLHWGAVCEKLSKEQVLNLQKFTDLALALANSNSL